MNVSQSGNISRTLKVSSSAVAKTIKRYDEIGSHEDSRRKGS
jgi:Mn-dependent DtxR family transcriptional regulator